MKKKILFYGYLSLLCFWGLSFTGCTTEDDLPVEGIISEVIYPDDHVEWAGGTRYFPIRQIFVNCEPSVFDIEWRMNYLNDAFAQIDVEFYVASEARLYVHDPHFSPEDVNNFISRRFVDVFYIDIDDLTLDGMAVGGYAVDGFCIVISNPDYAHKVSHINMFVHEFGHYFGLVHVYGDPNYPANFMGDSSSNGENISFQQDQYDSMLDYISNSHLLSLIVKGGYDE